MNLKRGASACALSILLAGCHTMPTVKSATPEEERLCGTLIDNAVNSLNDVARTHGRAQIDYNSQRYDSAIEELAYANTLFDRSKNNIEVIEQQEACGRVDMSVPYPDGTRTFDEFKKNVYDRAAYNSEELATVRKVKCAYTLSQVMPVLELTKPLISQANFREGMGFFESAIDARREINGMFITATDTIRNMELDQDCSGAPLQLIVNQIPVPLDYFKGKVYSSWADNGGAVRRLRAKSR